MNVTPNEAPTVSVEAPQKRSTYSSRQARNRKIYAVVAGLLALLMFFSSIGSTLIYASADEKAELQAQITDIEAQQAEAQAQVDAYADEIDAYAEKMSALAYQVQTTEREIDVTQQLIEALQSDVAIKEDEILLAEDKLEEKEELFATRVRVMYEVGDTTYLDVLLSSSSFTDMLSNIEIISQIMQFDIQVVEELEAARAELVALKEELEANVVETEQAKVELEEAVAALEVQQAEYQAIVDLLESDLALQESELARMNAEKDEINAEIERISKAEAEAAAAKAAAEAAAAAAAAGNSSSSSSSTSTGVTYTGTLTWPCPVYTYISSPFGYRTSPTAGASTLHKGVDLASATGNTVIAAESGTVSKSYYSSSYGNYIVISHGGGLMTAYAHLSVRSVEAGATVTAGQKIGEVGSTGISTGSHLHFEVYENGTAVDPMGYFS